MSLRNITVAATLALALASCGDPDAQSAAREGNAVVVEDITPVDGAAAAKPASGWTSKVRTTTQGGYVMGNPDAKVKLVEYGSRTCPACARFTAQAMKPLAGYVATGKVSYEFRDFIIHGGPDIAAAIVGRCGTPETFFPVLEATYAAQEASLGKLTSTSEQEQASMAKVPVQQVLAWMARRGGYVDIAKANGIPQAAAEKCLADEAATKRLVGMTDAAKDVQSTPTFIVNGKMLEAHDWSGVESALKAAGA